ncbi:beta strand repeat-containing protein, partial [Bathymodiolus heckerae thiotrophic gill symbiont]|uniref:beta strand repeat-containing protein n=1 Tax=Bathymodiolus heckerae thiotrophic gill symbiont TaxID=1052212 RepID=UPI0014851585
IDTIAPAQIDLGDSEAGIQNSSSTIINNTNRATTLATGIAFDASIVAPTETDIAQIKIVLGGLDTTNDKLILNTANINTNADITATTLTIASVAASYTLTGNTLVITKADGSNFSTANVKAIVEAIRLKNAETSPSEDDRTATFTYTDEHGNTTASATTTISVNLIAPDAVDLDAAAFIQDTSLLTINREQLAQGIAFDAAIATPIATDIIQIKVVIGGTNLDTTNDHLLLGLNNQVALNVNSADDEVSLGELTGVNYTYNATTKTLVLSKADGTNLSTLEVQQAIQSIELQNTTTKAAEGDRTATFTYIDDANNESASATATITVDPAASSLSAVDLDPTQANAQSNSATIVNKANLATTLTTGIAFDANIAAPTENDIAQIKVVLDGLDTANDKLILNTADINTNADIAATNLTIAGVAASYTLTGNTLVITKANGSNFNAAKVKDIVEAIRLKNAETNPSEGDRTATISYINTGNSEFSPATASIKVNLIAPDAVDLDATTADTRATEALTLNIANQAQLKAGIAFEANVAAPTATDITQIKVVIGGANLDTTNDQLLLGLNYNLDLNNDAQGNNVSLGAITGINYSYDKTINTLIISKDDASALSATEVQVIVASIKLQNTTQNPTQGDRTATFSYVDAADNEGISAITTLSVDTIAPAQIDLDNSEIGTQNSISTIVNHANRTTTLASATGIAFDTSIVVPTENDITQIKIVLGDLDTANDKLVLNTVDIDTNSDIATTNLTIASVVARYSLTGNTLIITKADNSNFNAAKVKDIVEAIHLKNTETNPSEGDRTATFTYIDKHGNTSASATATIVVDVTVPDAVNLGKLFETDTDFNLSDNMNDIAGVNNFERVGTSVTIWSEDIFSNEGFIGDGYAIAKVTANNQPVMFGLSTNDDSNSYTTIDYAIYIKENDIIDGVYENNVKTNLTDISFNTGDYIKVARIGTEIKYYHITAAEQAAGQEGTVIHTKTGVSATDKLFIDTSFRNIGSRLDEVKLFSRIKVVDQTQLVAGVVFDSNVVVPSAIDIKQIKVVLGGPDLDIVNDELFLDLYSSGIGNNSVDISNIGHIYTAATKTLLFFNKDGSNLDSLSVKAAIEAVELKNGSLTPVLGKRSITISYLDHAGNESDSVTTSIKVNSRTSTAIKTIDLDGVEAGTQTTSTIAVNIANLAATLSTGISLYANSVQPSEKNINVIKIHLGGANLDFTNDKLVLDADLSLNANAVVNNVVVGGVNVNYNYTTVTSNLFIVRSNGNNFPASFVDAIVKSINLKNTQAAPQEGDRTFAISYIDSDNNETPASTVTVGVDLTPAEKINLGGNRITTNFDLSAKMSGDILADEFEKTGTDGWDADVFSTEGFTGDGFVIAKITKDVNNGQRFMLGLSTDDSSNSYTTVDYAIYVDISGINSLYEGGTHVNITDRDYSAGDYVKVAREGTLIKYYHISAAQYAANEQGVLLRSRAATADKLYLDTSFHDKDTKVQDLQLFDHKYKVSANQARFSAGAVFDADIVTTTEGDIRQIKIVLGGA